MSADGFSPCPQCGSDIDEDGYGVREDFEFYLDHEAGMLDISYVGRCQNPNCDFEIEFSASQPFTVDIEFNNAEV